MPPRFVRMFFPKRRAEVDEAPAMRRDNYQSTSLENSRELMNPGLVGILGKMREHRVRVDEIKVVRRKVGWRKRGDDGKFHT